MKKWNEWIAGDEMSQRDVVDALGQISQGLLDGSIKGLMAGHRLGTIRFNMMGSGERQDDYCEILYNLSKINIKDVREFSSIEIKNIREKTKLNQFDFADKLGVSRDTVNSWECGRRRPGAAIRKLLELINADALDLISDI